MWKKELTATIQNGAKKAKLSGSTFHAGELNGKLDVVREKHNRTLPVIEYPGSITNLVWRAVCKTARLPNLSFTLWFIQQTTRGRVGGLKQIRALSGGMKGTLYRPPKAPIKTTMHPTRSCFAGKGQEGTVLFGCS